MLYGLPDFWIWRAVTRERHGGQYATVNGVRLYYETYGAGRPVLLLHGAGAFFDTMHYFLTDLARDHFVIAVDSRGQGRSTDSAGPLNYGLMAADMIGLLDVLHVKQADVVGWSDGGIIGLDMAMKHPDRVRRLVAIGANYDANGVDPSALDPAALAAIVATIKPIYNVIAPDPSHFPVMLKKIMTMIRSEPHYSLAQLHGIRARTLIVVGEHDIILTAHTQSLVAAIPGARKRVVAGANHDGPLEDPQDYTSISRAFIDAP